MVKLPLISILVRLNAIQGKLGAMDGNRHKAKRTIEQKRAQSGKFPLVPILPFWL